MRKWEELQKQKAFKKKILNARPTVTKNSQPLSSQPRSDRSVLSSLTRHEQQDPMQIPLYRVLKLYHLQQYASKLVNMGYGYQLQKLTKLRPQELKSLFIELNVLPGHATKLTSLFQYMSKIIPTLDSQEETSQPRSKDKSSINSNKNNHYTSYLNSPHDVLVRNQKDKIQTQNIVNRKDTSKYQSSQTTRHTKKPSIANKQEEQAVHINKNVKSHEIKGKSKQEDIFQTSDNEDSQEFDQVIDQIVQKYQSSIQNFYQNEFIKEKSQDRIKGKSIDKSKDKFIIQKPKQQQLQKINTQNNNQNKSNSRDRKTSNSREKMTSRENIKSQQPVNKSRSRELPSNENIKQQQPNKFNYQKKPVNFKSNLPKEEIKQKQIQTSRDSIKPQQKGVLRHLNNKMNTDVQQQKTKQQIVKEIMAIDLQIPQIQNLYQSFDNGKLRSTIINLDIEEMSYCLAKSIHKLVVQGNQELLSQNQRYLQQQSFQKQKNDNIKISDSNMKVVDQQNKNVTQNQDNNDIQGYIDQQYSQINKSNMKNSLCKISELTVENSELSHLLEKKILKHQFRKQQASQVKKSKQHLEDILRDSFIKYNAGEPQPEQQMEQQTLNNVTMSQFEHKQTDQSSLLSSFDSQDVIQNISLYNNNPNQQSQYCIQVQRQFQGSFKEQGENSQMPKVDSIWNLIKHVMVTCKMEKEVVIVALYYITKLVEMQPVFLYPNNWKKAIMISLMIASKVWDDQSYENENFAQAFPKFETKDINEMERLFLKLIKYELNVSPNNYTRYYFILRTHCNVKNTGYSLKPLNIRTITQLQNHQQSKFNKEQFRNPVNNSFNN